MQTEFIVVWKEKKERMNEMNWENPKEQQEN